MNNVWVKAFQQNPFKKVLPIKEVYIRYNKQGEQYDREIGGTLVVLELINNGWEDVEWLDETEQPESDVEAAAQQAARIGTPFSTNYDGYKFMFKAGAEWQRESSSLDAIEKKFDLLLSKINENIQPLGSVSFADDGYIDTMGKCANCGVEFHIHKSELENIPTESQIAEWQRESSSLDAIEKAIEFCQSKIKDCSGFRDRESLATRSAFIEMKKYLETLK